MSSDRDRRPRRRCDGCGAIVIVPTNNDAHDGYDGDCMTCCGLRPDDIRRLQQLGTPDVYAVTVENRFDEERCHDPACRKPADHDGECDRELYTR